MNKTTNLDFPPGSRKKRTSSDMKWMTLSPLLNMLERTRYTNMTPYSSADTITDL